VQTDIDNREQCQALVERTVAEFGRIDTLINNAGISMWTYFDQVQDLDIFEKIMRTN